MRPDTPVGHLLNRIQELRERNAELLAALKMLMAGEKNAWPRAYAAIAKAEKLK